MIGDNLHAGHRVYIAGQLQVRDFVNNENKKRQGYQISVGELYVSKMNETNECDEPMKIIDLNNVSIISHVISGIDHYETSSSFSVSYHYVKRY